MIVELLAGCSLTTILLTLCCGLVFYWWWTSKPDPPGIAPGYRGFTAFRKYYLSLIWPGIAPEVMGMKIAKELGPIYSYYFAGQLGTALNDYESIRKAFVDQGDACSGRLSSIGLRLDQHDAKSILATDGLFWREHRRFALTTLRDFGVGKASIEPKILDEISYLLKAVDERKGEVYNIADQLSLSICNNICLLEFGKRFEYTDQRFINLKRAFDERKALTGLQFLKVFFPILRFVPGIDRLTKADRCRELQQQMDDFVNEEITEHYKNYRPGSCDDYIDAYFTERALREKEGRSPELFDDVALMVNMELFFVAGTDTTSTTLRWAFLHLIRHPDIQAKIQKEIDDVIGRHRMPSYDDRPSMPFTEATIFETHRIGSVAPQGMPHKALEDVKLNGFNIPKDTIISSNLYGVHHDPALYPDPHTFRPERFINEKGVAVKPDWLIPFSMGKRFCLGEPLARMEIFLYLTSLLQRFTLTKVEGDVLTDVIITLTRELRPFNMRILPRE